MRLDGALTALHEGDEDSLFGTLLEAGTLSKWKYVVPTAPAMTAGIKANPHFGLASDDEAGRGEAVQMG